MGTTVPPATPFPRWEDEKVSFGPQVIETYQIHGRGMLQQGLESAESQTIVDSIILTIIQGETIDCEHQLSLGQSASTSRPT